MSAANAATPVEFDELPDHRVIAAYFDMGVTLEEMDRIRCMPHINVIDIAAGKILRLAQEDKIRHVRFGDRIRFRAWETSADLVRLGFRQLGELPVHWRKPDSTSTGDPVGAMTRAIRSGAIPDPTRPRPGQYREVTSAMKPIRTGPGVAVSRHGLGGRSFEADTSVDIGGGD